MTALRGAVGGDEGDGCFLVDLPAEFEADLLVYGYHIHVHAGETRETRPKSIRSDRINANHVK